MGNKKLYTKEQLEVAVATSTNLWQTLSKLTSNPRAGHYPGLRNKIKIWNIDTSHFVPNRGGWNRGQENKGRWGLPEIPLEEVLVENSSYNRSRLKQRLLKVGLKRNECELCGQGPTWNGKLLVLQLDHVNGVHDDNRLDNLRMICPNCHTQTPTFCSRNRKTKTSNPDLRG